MTNKKLNKKHTKTRLNIRCGKQTLSNECCTRHIFKSIYRLEQK